eukprot:scaffold6065_cov21-Tisochrysis_lutea.AAC.2
MHVMPLCLWWFAGWCIALGVEPERCPNSSMPRPQLARAGVGTVLRTRILPLCLWQRTYSPWSQRGRMPQFKHASPAAYTWWGGYCVEDTNPASVSVAA